MSPAELRFFRYLYTGNFSELQNLCVTESAFLSFQFPKTSSVYFSTNCETITCSPLYILGMVRDLWQFFREENWNMKHDAILECEKIEKCFGLFGVINGEYAVDYYSMYYLKTSLLEGEEWFGNDEQIALLKAGFKRNDIALFNAAQKSNIALVQDLLKKGGDPTIDLYNENVEGDLISSLFDDVLINKMLYEEYYDSCSPDKKLNHYNVNSMLCVLYEMASSATLLRLIKTYQK